MQKMCTKASRSSAEERPIHVEQYPYGIILCKKKRHR